MRRDLLIGILVSVFVHVGFLYSEDILNFKPKAKVVQEAPPTIEAWTMPPLEPDKPDTPPEQEDMQNLLTPPTLMDVPTTVSVDAFTQPIQPPPPNVKKGGITDVPIAKPSAKVVEVFNPRDLDQQVSRTYPAPPVYPSDLKRQGIGAKVTVLFIVDAHGEVDDVHVVESSNPAFNDAAMDAVKKSRFRPGKKGGKSVASHVAIPFEFNVNDE